ncbi:fructosamine kinase family protein [Lactiplantibacillus daowaiensis]|uniref:Fructosamine kinase family protein n=1 Tax=Lactiplantibacillus daowaiensis TaxID=2559918 RepID=A0ABW1S230_9LACO|nr:fructosamine kinase family protein [Lactiplantibacillus daowaiensis]
MQLTTTWLAQLPLKSITTMQPVTGGDINAAFKLTSAGHDYFLKVQPQQTAAFFAHEVDGLTRLSHSVKVPKVIATGTINGDGYLLQAWSSLGTGQQFDLGQAVAQVHQQTASQFGLAHNFLLGKIPKYNQWQTSWSTFYTTQRLDVLVKLAIQQQHWSPQRESHYQHLRQIILADTHMQTVQPSLLHGDLWAGNVGFDAHGIPVLLDPDICYGDREFDLAMTTLFGGFTAKFYQGYQSVMPFTTGWQTRLPWYQLYYLLAHLNLFGATYGPAVDHILNQY